MTDVAMNIAECFALVKLEPWANRRENVAALACVPHVEEGRSVTEDRVMSLAISETRPGYCPGHEKSAFRPPAPVPLDAPLGTLGLLRALRDNPIATWTKAHFDKPVLFGRGILGPVAVVSDPDLVRHVLVENMGNYTKDVLQRRMLAPGIGQGLLLAEGAEWRSQRRALASLFAPRHVLGFQDATAEEATAMTERWERRRSGRTADISVEMARVTLRILGRTIFSDALSHSAEEFASVVSRFLESVGQLDPFDALDMPDWVPRLGRIRNRPMLRFFETAVETMIAKRRLILSDDRGAAPRDLLTLLLEAADPETGVKLSDEEIKANLVTFIIAGHETTSNALTWALFLMSQDEASCEAVEREVDRFLPDGRFVPGSLDALVMTRAVLDEAMRLYPPAATISRQALGPDRLGSLSIKARTMVVISPYVLHRHNLLWQTPDRFIPSRFLPENRGDIDRYAYLPFGAGPRVCIGASFALQEAVIVLATAIRRFRFRLAPGHEVMPIQRVALRSRGGMPMTITRRA